MMPEETVQAAVDLKTKVVLPVHWGKFTLAMHGWDEPIERVLKKAEELNMQVAIPKIGEPFMLDENVIFNKWWKFNSEKNGSIT